MMRLVAVAVMRWLMAVMVILVTATVALAAQSVRVEWGYTPPMVPAVTGYQLYQNGTPVTIWPGAATASGDVTLPTLAIGDNFTLTAMFADATESPHSAPFIWTGGINIKFATIKSGNSHGWTNKPGQVHLQ